MIAQATVSMNVPRVSSRVFITLAEASMARRMVSMYTSGSGEIGGVAAAGRGDLCGGAAHGGGAFSYAVVRGALGGSDGLEYSSRSEGVGGLNEG